MRAKLPEKHRTGKLFCCIASYSFQVRGQRVENRVFWGQEYRSRHGTLVAGYKATNLRTCKTRHSRKFAEFKFLPGRVLHFALKVVPFFMLIAPFSWWLINCSTKGQEGNNCTKTFSRCHSQFPAEIFTTIFFLRRTPMTSEFFECSKTQRERFVN